MMFLRIQGGLEPFDVEAHKAMLEAPVGETVAFDKVIKPRNVKFHRKYFALLNFAFENWTPGKLSGKRHKGVTPEKNFERFRADLTILCGHYKQTIRTDNSLNIEPKSISFASMNKEQFEELYSNTINVILKRILTNYNKEQLDSVIIELLGFDG